MKKLKLYIFSSFCLTLFILSESKPFMEWWTDYRVYDLNMPFARAKYGDMYSGCFLPQYIDSSARKLREYTSTKNLIDLYVLHDSYLENKIKKENFIGVNKLTLVNYRSENSQIKLNKKNKNILIIECSERTADWRITDTSITFQHFLIHKQKKVAEKTQKKNFISRFFNPYIDQNLELNLFDYELIRPIKEAKANLNFTLFERLPKDITVSRDKNYLLLTETVDINYFQSSFRKVSDQEIVNIVYMMNLTEIHYKKLGFDDVYFSIIPNPVSIVDTERDWYNYKIARIKNTSWRHVKFIDVFDVFKTSRKRVYRRDDSHWNSNGVQLWVDQVNSNLLNY